MGTFVYFAPGAVFVSSTLLPHLILILGATISLVSFLGYYGAMNEKRWILWIHGLILLIAIALQITVGAIAFVYRNQGNKVLDKAWDRVYRSDPRVIQDLESFLVSLLGAAILFHRFDQQRYQRECDEGEAALYRALLEAQHVDGHIEEARRQRERQMEYEALADRVRAETLARAHEEGLLFSRSGGRDGEASSSAQGRPRDPPPYGTFDTPHSASGKP
ncbi:hypothetical protein EDD11_007222 [Mortierella claussenii]|nr:hypothetical protein EDD11_007222 [Mortierella claussenii]